MRAFVVLGLVFSIPSQEIGSGKRLRNDLFCVEGDINPQLNQSLVCSLHPHSEYSCDTAVHYFKSY